MTVLAPEEGWSGFRPTDGLMLLPVFFSTLCISPNFNTGPLGNVALVLLMLWFPAGVLAGRYLRTFSRGWLMASLVLFGLSALAAFRGGMPFGITVLAGIGMFFILLRLRLLGAWMAGVADGLLLGFFPVLFAYLGFNDYGGWSVFQEKVLALSAVWLFGFAAGRWHDPKAAAAGTAVSVIGLWALVAYFFGMEYARQILVFMLVPIAGLSLAFLPRFRRHGYVQVWRMLTALILTVAFIRLFLVYTNVIQVFS